MTLLKNDSLISTVEIPPKSEYVKLLKDNGWIKENQTSKRKEENLGKKKKREIFKVIVLFIYLFFKYRKMKCVLKDPYRKKRQIFDFFHLFFIYSRKINLMLKIDQFYIIF